MKMHMMHLNQKDGVTKTVEGAGSIAIIGLMYAYLGPAAIAFNSMSIFGNTLRDTLSEIKESSFNQTINELREEGKINEQQFNLMLMIHNMSDKEWEDLEKQLNTEINRIKESGNLTEDESDFIEQCEWIKSIRKMSEEDWQNENALLKATQYSFSISAWEAMQWYVGGHLFTWISNRAARIGVDTSFNAVDTLYRACMRSATLGESFEEAWIKEGGWESTIINTTIGLSGSAVGEVIDYNRYKDCDCKSFKEFQDEIKRLDANIDNKISPSDIDDFIRKNSTYVTDNISDETVRRLSNIAAEYNAACEYQIDDLFKRLSTESNDYVFSEELDSFITKNKEYINKHWDNPKVRELYYTNGSVWIEDLDLSALPDQYRISKDLKELILLRKEDLKSYDEQLESIRKLITSDADRLKFDKLVEQYRNNYYDKLVKDKDFLNIVKQNGGTKNLAELEKMNYLYMRDFDEDFEKKCALSALYINKTLRQRKSQRRRYSRILFI